MSRPTRTAPPPTFAALVQAFFAEHLTQQRAMSPRTVAAYRDALRAVPGLRRRRACTSSRRRCSWPTSRRR